MEPPATVGTPAPQAPTGNLVLTAPLDWQTKRWLTALVILGGQTANGHGYTHNVPYTVQLADTLLNELDRRPYSPS